MIYKNIMMAILALNLGACASADGAFPSLAKRPFERPVAPVAPDGNVAAPVVALPYELKLEIDALMARNKLADAQFAAALPPVKIFVEQALSAPVASEDWVNAQLQLSRLDKIRADSVVVQGEMDLLVTAQMDAESQNQLPAVSSFVLPYQTQIADAVAMQNLEITKLAQLLMQ